MQVVAIVGCLTALFAATIGLVQTDIKKVLAYSTVSQLGYMFLACGVGAFSAGIFHLMTHAFFKGLLFLAAGSVIHAMGGEQDMRKMGGLRKKIPVTFWTMFMATLAIAGAPGFSGFFSKDEILDAAQRVEPAALGAGRSDRGPHFVLHVPPAVSHVLRHGALRRASRARARIAEEHARAADRSRDSFRVRRLDGRAAALGRRESFRSFPRAGAFDCLGTVPLRPRNPRRRRRRKFLQALFGAPVIAGLLGFLLAWWFYIRSPETPKKIADFALRAVQAARAENILSTNCTPP